MYSIAGKIIDVYDDINLDILKEGIEKIGSLELAPRDEVYNLDNDSFALIFMTKTGEMIKKYPIHTPDSLKISEYYFEKTAHKIPQNCRDMAIKNFDIAKRIFQHNYIEKNASLKINNMINLSDCTNPSKKTFSYFALNNKYPLNDESQIKLACDYFNLHAKFLEPEDRHIYADNTIKRASQLNIDIDDDNELHKYAGSRFGNTINYAKIERENILQHDILATRALDHLFEKKANFSPNDFAKSLENFDRSNFIDKYWDRNTGIRNPYKSTYENVKLAKVIKVGQDSINEEEIFKIANSDEFKQTFSSEFAESFSNDPVTIFKSLPRPEQEIIMSMTDNNK